MSDISMKATWAGSPRVIMRKGLIIDKKSAFDGYRLSRLSFGVTLTCKRDFDDLIKLLEIHKNCFDE